MIEEERESFWRGRFTAPRSGSMDCHVTFGITSQEASSLRK